jgi:hypothetical protein
MELVAGPLLVRVPERADGVLHVERSHDAFVDVVAIGAASVAGVRRGGEIAYEGAFPGTRVVHVAEKGRTEELRHVERDAGPLAYRVRLGPGLARLRVVDDYVEALDARGVALLRTEPAHLVDARGTRRDLRPSVEARADGWSLRWDVDDRGLVYPLDIDPAWTTTGSLAKARRDGSAHAVAGGKVVAIGGINLAGTDLSSVEVWDPATGSWTSGGSLIKPRSTFASCTLASGKVFVAGGPLTNLPADIDSSAEIYDPATGTSNLLTSTSGFGGFARAVPVSASQVLVAHTGGSQLVDVVAGTFQEIPYVSTRAEPMLAALPGGKALVMGGHVGIRTNQTSTAEIFDLATKKWTATASMTVGRDHAEAVALPSGKVLVAGGFGLSSAELFDPTTKTWSSAGNMTTLHAYYGMVVLPSGRALAIAGDLTAAITPRTDLYDPATNSWSFAGDLEVPVDDFAFTVLSSGKVMVVGGSNGAPSAFAQLFDPLPVGKACLGPGECTSGFCVDGACCGTSSCATGETCGGSGVPGLCKKRDGASCVEDSECGSAHCVDGLCCATACTETCAACDLKGSEGKCVAVAAGDAPHGKRPACPGDDVCRARCGGIDATKCTQFPAAAIVCAEPSCKDGVETALRGCDSAGSCAPASTHPCDPYVCGESACKTQCDSDADCSTGNGCDLVTRKCVIAAKCEGEHTVSSPDGKTKDCSPYRCDLGKCIDACSDSTACVAGFVCDSTSSHCVPGEGPSESGGGCSTSPGARGSGVFVGLALLALARGRRSLRL